ncbi:MAG: 1-acyl-sn-glycerol-3-phosphate acyltransferase [Treponema sp.]|nr:1-acyl-sn-glycerol-3-phosphate acyltransferase [Treponema sp.]
MIKTIFCFTYAAISMVLLTPIGLITALMGMLGLRTPMDVLIYRIAQGWARLFILFIGCKMTVSGSENIPKKGGVCFASNHCSIADILMLLGYAGRPFGFIAKKELLKIPFLNVWISVLGGLFIDRGNPRSALKTINAGITRIKSGSSMVIFPEGTRSRGKGILPFRPGAFKLATQSQAVIVPIALSGTYDIFEKNYRACAAPVSVTFCKPINAADIPPEDRKQVLADRIYEVIKEALSVNPH